MPYNPAWDNPPRGSGLDPDKLRGYLGSLSGAKGAARAGKTTGLPPIAAFDSAAAGMEEGEEEADRRFGGDISPGRGENERIRDYEIEQDRRFGGDISPGPGENERLEKMPYGTGPGQSGTQFGYEPYAQPEEEEVDFSNELDNPWLPLQFGAADYLVEPRQQTIGAGGGAQAGLYGLGYGLRGPDVWEERGSQP